MADLQALIHAIDALNPEEFDQLYQYVAQKRRSIHWWVVPQENLEELHKIGYLLQEDSANLSEEEINALIDESIAEVRYERRKNQGRD